MKTNPVKRHKQRNMKTSLLVNWKTTAGGIAALLGGLALLLKMLSGEEAFNTDQLAIALGMIGTGIAGLMARDADKSSQDNNIRGLVLCLLPLLLFIGESRAGEGEEVIVPAMAVKNTLPSIDDPEGENWLDKGSLWTFAWYDFAEKQNGLGIRLAYDITEQIRFRWDYLVEDAGIGYGVFSDNAELTLSMRYDVFPSEHVHPYLIAGGGSASISSFQWQYLIGAGADYEFSNGITLFTEFLHIRTEEDSFSDRNEIRFGVGIPLSSLSGASNLWKTK